MKLTGDVFMLEELDRFLKCHDMPWPSNVVSSGSGRAAFGTGIPTQDTQVCLFGQQIVCSSVKFGGGCEALERLPAGKEKEAIYRHVATASCCLVPHPTICE